jgi:hypothetical protein
MFRRSLYDFYTAGAIGARPPVEEVLKETWNGKAMKRISVRAKHIKDGREFHGGKGIIAKTVRGH